MSLSSVPSNDTHHMSIKVCTNHGLPFENDPVSFPVHVRTNGTWVMSPLAFCRLECAKTYLADHHPNLLDLFEQYSHDHHAVSHVSVLPSPSCLSHFQVDPGAGVSLTEYFSTPVTSGGALVVREREFGGVISQSVSEDHELKVDRWPVILEEHRQKAVSDPELSSTVFKLDASAHKGLIDVEGFSVTHVPRQQELEATVKEGRGGETSDCPASSVMDFEIQE